MQKKKIQKKVKKETTQKFNSDGACPQGPLLVIDSSCLPLTAGVRGADGKAYGAQKDGLKQEEYLFPLIAKLCKKAKIKFKDIKQVFFIKGPGRFTGIRIAITLASVLKELCGAKVFSATVFDALKEQALTDKTFKEWSKKNPNGFLIAAAHAFRQEYFICAYALRPADAKGAIPDGADGGAPRAQLQPVALEPMWLDLEGVSKYFARLKAPLFIVGLGLDSKPLKNFFPSGAKYFYARGAANKVCAQTLFALAGQKIQAAKDGAKEEKDVFTPLYLKPARFELALKDGNKDLRDVK